MNLAIGITFALAAMFILSVMIGKYLKWNRVVKSIPVCFGDMPDNPQHRAENDCYNCEHRGECFFSKPPRGLTDHAQAFPDDSMGPR